MRGSPPLRCGRAISSVGLNGAAWSGKNASTKRMQPIDPGHLPRRAARIQTKAASVNNGWMAGTSQTT